MALGIGRALQTAARNAWAVSFGDGIEPERHTPSTVVHDEEHQVLRRFGDSVGRPVLMVPPLAAPATCFDLTPGQSVAEFIGSIERTPYLVDYGDIRYADRHRGMDYWFDEVIPNAIRRVSALEGDVEVDVIGWSLGGTMSLLTAAAHNDLPIRSVTVVGTPIDYRTLPVIRLYQLSSLITRGEPLMTFNKLAGGIPPLFVRTGYRLAAIDRELTKPAYIARNLLDADALARMQVIDRFMAVMPAYPGRFFEQLTKRLMFANDLATGEVKVGGRTVELSRIEAPTLSVAGTDDTLCGVRAAAAIQDVLTGAPSVRFETVPGSHLGILTGAKAHEGLWLYFEEFLRKLDAQAPARS